MPSFEFTSPEGKVYTVEGPDGATKEQAFKMLQTKLGASSQPAPQAAEKPDTFIGSVAQGAGNLVAGAVRGAGSIGATILAPYDMAKDALNGKGWSLESNRQRRADIDGGLQLMGADTDSGLYKTGKIVGEIAGTAGAGGVLANGVRAVSQAPRAAAFANALQTGGMRAGATPGAANMLTRSAGGAVTGGAMAGMIDPESAGMGALIGGALPPVLNVAGKALPMIGRGVANAVGGLGTHTGGETIKQAARSGIEGGASQRAFTQNMRGQVPMDDVLNTAKSNLENMRSAKSAEYRSGMVDIAADKTVLSFGGIDKAIKDAAGVVTFKGQVKNAKAAEVLQKMSDEIAAWKKLSPGEFHTPEGLDAIKQKVGALVESIPFEEKTARMIGNNVYKSIKTEITKQAPVYDKVMKGYSEATNQITEIERALSLGKKASVDTAMRKLQSLTRNNVNTNYGNRLTLAQQLEQQGGNELMPALAGQALSSWTPRGIGGATAGISGLGGYALGGPALAAGVLATQSPRLMGEAALKVGQAYRGAGSVGNKLAPIVYRSAPVVGAQ